MDDARFGRLLRTVLTAALVCPPAALACGGKLEPGAPAEDAGPAPDSPPDATAPRPDASDAALCADAQLPDPSTCSGYRQAPCDLHTDDAGSLSKADCLAVCGLGPTGVPPLDCAVGNDPAGRPYVGCYYCVVGRRPEGLVPAAAAGGADVGAFFADVAALEAASIVAFGRLHDDLVRLGAPRGLVRRAARAAADETRHARQAAALALSLGATTGSWQDPPRVPAVAERDLEAVARENAVEGCVRETMGAVTALFQASHAGSSAVRRHMTGVAEDEGRHAALAWAIARWAEDRLDAAARARVAGATTDALDALARELESGPPAAVVRAAGLPDVATSRRLFDALRACLPFPPTGPTS